jgi:hypothetical protein
MNRFRAVNMLAALVLILCVAVAGAGKYSEKTLIGTWEFDMLAIYKQAMEKTGQELPQGMTVEALVGDSFMRMTFMKDGTFTFESKAMQREVTEEGKWELVEIKENTVTIKSVNAEGEEQIVPMTFADNDNFEAVMSEGEMEMTMKAKRVKPEKKDVTKEKKTE